MALPQDRVDLCELHGVVDGEDVLGRHGIDRGDGAAIIAEQLEHVGQVVLAAGVLVPDARERVEEVVGAEAVVARVDLADRALGVARVLLLDDLGKLAGGVGPANTATPMA